MHISPTDKPTTPKPQVGPRAACGIAPHELHWSVHLLEATFYISGKVPESQHMHAWIPIRLENRQSRTHSDLVPTLHVALSAVDFLRVN
jgi:hypothetical protein